MSKKYVIALDIGGTKIEAAVVDKQGQIVVKERVLTQAEKGQKAMLDNLVDLINLIKRNFENELDGIGIAIPGFPDKDGNLVWSGPNIKPLEGFNLKVFLEDHFKLPVRLENDANCFALAEAVYGAGKGYNYVLGIIWGTGIGLGTVLNKKIHSGAIGGAGEFGHIYLPYLKDNKMEYEYLERLASGKHIVRHYLAKGGLIDDPDPAKIYDSQEDVALEVMDNAIHFFGLGISYLVNILNPGVIVLGGGVSNLPDKVYDQIKQEVKKYALEPLTKELKITRYKVSDSAGLLGAANLL